MPRTKKITTEKKIVETKKPAIAEKEVVKTPEVPEISPSNETLEFEEKTITFPKTERYFEATGRRKTSIARVRLFTKGDKEIIVNDKPYAQYFQSFEMQKSAISPLDKMKCLDKFRVVIRTSGGGMHSQAEAVRHGISRALVVFNQDFKKRLKRSGFLTRDARMRERKKFGLKRARKAPQWAKR